MTATQALATELLAMDVAPAALGRAQDFLLDFFGVALGGVPEPSTVTLRRGLGVLQLHGTAGVLGTGDRLPAPQAALANGAAAHTLEMDDTHQGGSIHLGASVFPAALAAATLRPTTGETLLRAAVAGYEVAARLAMALKPGAHYARGFHPTGTCGAFGAATAAAIVLGLDAPALVDALGIAGSQASGSMEFLESGAWTKRFHPGWAACAGLHAAALASAGFRAPATILEGRFGTLAGYSGDADASALRPGDGVELLRTSIKPHACCRYMQAPIDATLALCGEHHILAADVEHVEVGIVEAGFPIVCEPVAQKRRPTSVVDAQFSLPFGIAVAIARGSASPDDFTPAVFEHPTVVDLMARVTAVRDAALDAQYPRTWPAWVRITRRDGRTHEAALSHPRGDPESFPTRDELLGKFRRLAGRTLPGAQVDTLAAMIDDVRRLDDVTRLVDATRPRGS